MCHKRFTFTINDTTNTRERVEAKFNIQRDAISLFTGRVVALRGCGQEHYYFKYFL